MPRNRALNFQAVKPGGFYIDLFNFHKHEDVFPTKSNDDHPHSSLPKQEVHRCCWRYVTITPVKM